MERNAIRLGDPNSIDSLTRVVDRYGAIEDETFDKIISWLDNHKKEYNYEIVMEIGNQTIKVNKVGSMIYKHLDNQHDALNTLKNLI